MAVLQYLYTNDVSTMHPDQVRYGLVCNERGGILDDVLVYNFDPFWLMVVNASNRPKILDWIERQRSGFDIEVKDLTTNWAMIAIQGPRAVGIVEQTLRTDVPLSGMKYYYGRMLAVSATPFQSSMVVSRTGYTGEDGFEIMCPADRVVNLVEGLTATARQLGWELKPCGLGARDTLRLEAAMPLYGHELGEDIDPFQAGLAWAVKLDKGDFIGREALLRRRDDPAPRQRVGLALEGKRIAREGAALLHEGREVGRVTSGTFGPTVGQSIAMAYVERTLTLPGTALSVDVRGKAEPARVVPLPFYRRAKS
jgi:aminomethyltransferase